MAMVGSYKHQTENGFTLIELVVVMALLASAMLAATTTFIYIARLQQRGAVQRQIQQSGRYLLEDIARAVRNSTSVTVTNGGKQLTLTDNSSNSIIYTFDGSSTITRTIGGGPALNINPDNVRVTNFLVTYKTLNNVKPYVEIIMKVEQKDAALSAFNIGTFAYDLRTTATPRTQ